MSPVETEPLGEQLKRIEVEIRKLKIQYDLYFVGSMPRPPNDQRDMVKKAIRQYEGVPMRNAADRFFYNALVNKFRAFSELWNKGVRRREEGTRIHPLAARAARKAARTETGGTFRPPVGAGARTPRGRAPVTKPDSWRIPVGRRDEAALKNLYQSFITAKENAGDKKRPSYDAFAREIAKHAAALKGKGNCEAIDFKIQCKDNKVSIKAKPIR
jgi:hypothetical protein